MSDTPFQRHRKRVQEQEEKARRAAAKTAADAAEAKAGDGVGKRPASPMQRQQAQQNQAAMAGQQDGLQQPAGLFAQSRAATGDAAEFAADLESLHGLTREEKTRIKREVLLPKWLPKVEAFLATADGRVNHPAAGWVVVWMADVGDVDRLLRLGMLAAEKGQQPTGKPFATNLREFVIRRVLDWSAEQIKNGASPQPYLDTLFVLEPDIRADLHTQAHALAGKWAAQLAETAQTPEERRVALELADHHLTIANEGGGKVTTLLGKVKGWLGLGSKNDEGSNTAAPDGGNNLEP